MPYLGGMQPTERLEVEFGNDVLTFTVYVRFLHCHEFLLMYMCPKERKVKDLYQEEACFERAK